MISEITFSKKFTSFWNQLLPNANNYVRLINGGLLEICYEPLTETKRKENIVLINEIFFRIYLKIISNEVLLSQINKKSFYSQNKFNRILEESIEYLSRFTYGSNFSLPMNIDEMRAIKQLVYMVYDRYQEQMDSVEATPIFSGCGFVNHSQGDIYLPGKLVEIKAGERSFSVVDFRQVLIYCTLNFYSKKQKIIQDIELFNPRMGIAYSCTVKDLCYNLGSLQPEDLFFEIKNFITENTFIEDAIANQLA